MRQAFKAIRVNAPPVFQCVCRPQCARSVVQLHASAKAKHHQQCISSYCTSSSSCAMLERHKHNTTQQRRLYSTNPHERPPAKKGFLDSLTSAVKDEMRKNKELQENQQRLAEEMKKLNDSESLKAAREKFEVINRETMNSTERLTNQLKELRSQMSTAIAEVRKTEYGKKISDAGEKVLNATRDAAKNVQNAAEALGDTPGVKQVADTMKIVQEEISEVAFADARVYKAPEELRLRSETSYMMHTRTVEVNTDATGVQLHSSARWAQAWRSFVDHNPVVNKWMDLKIRYDESDNPLIRLSRFITDGVSSIVSSDSNMSQVLTEIAKVDPDFDLGTFQRYIETEMIPNVLEAFFRCDTTVLSDWLHERALLQLKPAMDDMKKLDLTSACRIMDTSRVEVEGGAMKEQGPMFVIRFNAWQVDAWKDKTGKVVLGDADTPVRVFHAWAVYRDMENLDPHAAWKVLELHFQKV